MHTQSNITNIIYLVFADWLIDPDKKVGGYQITLPYPAGGILDYI
jgi:hypothetical protein